jgi:hypothetical protein
MVGACFGQSSCLKDKEMLEIPSTSAPSKSLASPLGRPSLAGAARKLVFGISTEEVRLSRRGFVPHSDFMRERLERIGLAFVSGYHAALAERGDFGRLAVQVAEQNEHELQGFAYEGAGMGLALVDQLGFGRRFARLLAEAPQHFYLILVGAGWALARLHRRSLPAFAASLDDLHWPLVFDGYGFHQGYFDPASYVRKQKLPPLSGYAARGFDQGLGRCLFFVEGGSPERLVKTVLSFAAGRRPDIWSGVGLACTYAGGIDAEGLAYVGRAAAADGAFGQLCQGVVFAAAARERAGNSSPATRLACATLCRLEPAAAAALAETSKVPLPAARRLDHPVFEDWRRHIAAAFPEVPP